MNFTKSSCPHIKFEKSFLSIYACKHCSTTQIISLPKLLKKKSHDIFSKPLEYCFNYEINIIELIRNQIYEDEKNFINYKKPLENLNKSIDDSSNKVMDLNDSFCSNKDDESIEEDSSAISEKIDEKDFLNSLNIYYKNRKDILSQIKNLCNKYSTSKYCFYLTMSLIEKFFKMSNSQKINNYQMDLVINTIFILSYKYVDTDSEYYLNYKTFKTFFHKGKKHIKTDDLKIAEIQCLQILEYNLNIPTILNFLELVLSSGIILDKETNNFNIISKIYSECFNLLDYCFNDDNIMLEYSMSEIVFSIIYIVRKRNNLIYNIEKYYSKIYNIELKKYLKCIKNIASIFYKNDAVNNNLFVSNEERKNNLINSEKKMRFDINDSEINDYKKTLKPIFQKLSNDKIHISSSYDGKSDCNKNINSYNRNKFSFLSSKSKSINNINNSQEKIQNPYNVKIFQYNIKEKDKDKNKNNSILYDCSLINKNKNISIDKIMLKPLKSIVWKPSRNFINIRYKNVSNNNSSISTHNNSNNNNEIKNKLYKNNSNLSSVDVNRSSIKNLYCSKDSINSNNSRNNGNGSEASGGGNIPIGLVKVSSSNNLLASNYNLNSISINIKKSSNNLRKSFEIQNKIKNQMIDSNELSGKKELINYLNNNSTRKNDFNINNENNLRIKLKFNKERKNNLFKLSNKLNNNINERNIKLPLIKKSSI